MKKIINLFLCWTLALSVFIAPSYADETIEIQHNSWGCDALKVDDYIEYASSHSNGNSVIVAVLDTGVDYTHSFLKDRMVYNEDGTISGYDFVDEDDDPMDDMYTDETYHGSHVAGIIADCTQTLDIKILPVRVGDIEGYFDAEDVANGIYYAVEQGASVINCSFYVDYGDFQLVYDALDYAIDHNVTIVVSANNDGCDMDELEERCPTIMEDVICVSNIKYKDEEYQLSITSNYGELIDFGAPGSTIISCKGGNSDDLQILSGTSMAAPHIAACAAMLYLTNPDITPKEVEEELIDSCLDLGDEGKDIYFGYGLPQMDCLIPEETVVTEEKSNTTHYGIIAAGAVLVIGAGVVVVYLKKRRK